MICSNDFREGEIAFYGFDSKEPFWYKRQSFAHEREVRAIIDTSFSLVDEKGIFEPVNLEVLIEKIIVGPKTPDWFYNSRYFGRLATASSSASMRSSIRKWHFRIVVASWSIPLT